MMKFDSVKTILFLGLVLFGSVAIGTFMNQNKLEELEQNISMDTLIH